MNGYEITSFPAEFFEGGVNDFFEKEISWMRMVRCRFI